MSPRRSMLVGLVAILALLVVLLSARTLFSPVAPETARGALASNPDLDPGTGLSGRAPDFTLTDQSGRTVSLDSFRGQVVMLAFTDARCTTVCPLTTTEMLDAKRLLGPAGRSVQLLGVDANPTAGSVADVRSYSEAHNLMGRWDFLTGSREQLKRVWRAYDISVQIQRGQIDHTPALYLIGPTGRLAKVYMTEMAYAGIRQQAQILAQEIASLLPDHPRVRSNLSYRRIPGISPSTEVDLPSAAAASDAGPHRGSRAHAAGRADRGTVAGRIPLGPGSARLLLFFDTWSSRSLDLRAQLEKLGRYRSAATSAHLPEVVAIDEASVEPSPTALAGLLGSLAHPLAYPVGIDASGRLADGYGVQDEPWLVLVSATGRILWSHDVSASGWPSTAELVKNVRAALEHPPGAPRSAAAAVARLAGSPGPLAALHAQADRLIPGNGALQARLRSLRGYPVVLNVWASWCSPCRRELPLLAAAAAGYGRRIAFVGADLEDSAAGARSQLEEEPLSYPSYETSAAQLSAIAPVEGTPTTIFIDGAERVVHVHIGQYANQSALDSDIEKYTPGG